MVVHHKPNLPSSLFSDPWGAGEEAEADGGWLISFVDLLSLVLAMVVLLLGHAMAQRTEERPAPPPPPVAAAGPAPQAEAPRAAPAPPRSEPAAEPVPVRSPLWLPFELPFSFLTDALAGDQAAEADAAPEEAAAEPVAATAQATLVSESRLLDQVQERLAGLVTAVRDERGVSLEIGEAVLFASAQAELLPSALPVLQRLAQALAEAGEVAIAVEGHTDDRPTRGGRFPSNWELSAARASAVTRYLIERGIPAIRLRSVGYADTWPVADNATVEGRAQNRRVNILVEFLSAPPLP